MTDGWTFRLFSINTLCCCHTKHFIFRVRISRWYRGTQERDLIKQYDKHIHTLKGGGPACK